MNPLGAKGAGEAGAVGAPAAIVNNPHLPPVLRFDPTGSPDRLPALLQAARTRALTDEEARTLAGALRTQEPWLEWAGKRERKRGDGFRLSTTGPASGAGRSTSAETRSSSAASWTG